jgi:hypothetical protein
VTRKPIEQREMHQIPGSRVFPVAETSPARHSTAAAQFAGQQLPRDAAPKDKENAGQTRSIRDRGLPPFGRRGGIGSNGSTRSHNASGSSVAAITAHITALDRV